VTEAVHATVASLLRSSATAGAHGGGSLVTRSSPTAHLEPSLASPRLQLRRAAAEDSGARRRLGFGEFQALRAKMRTMGCAIYRGFWIGS
jgi:hypothetical protein